MSRRKILSFDGWKTRFLLKLFLVESVLEEHENRLFGTVDLHVLAHDDHGFGVHGLTGEELKILEPAQQIFHHLQNTKTMVSTIASSNIPNYRSNNPKHLNGAKIV